MKSNKVRITIDVSQDFNQRLEKLRDLVEVDTKSDTIRQALQVYEYLAQKTALGFTFKMVVPGGGVETELVILGPPTQSISMPSQENRQSTERLPVGVNSPAVSSH